MSFDILPERPRDAALIDPLLDRTFGFDRKQKTVYRLREGIDPLRELSFVAVNDDGGLMGSIRYWPVLLRGRAGLLLGPLAVEPALQGQGIGKALVGYSMKRARALDHGFCIVVGEPSYYQPYGFFNASALGLILPGPVEPERFLAAELSPGCLASLSGVIGRNIGGGRRVG